MSTEVAADNHKKGLPWWVWALLALLVAGLIWFFIELTDSEGEDPVSEPVATATVEASEPAATATVEASEPAATVEASEPAATATGSAPAEDDPVSGATGVATAIATAEGAVEGGEAVLIDREAEGESWIVGVASGEIRTEIIVSADGEEVLEQDEEIALTDDKVVELDRATVTLAEAVETAFGEVNGTLARAGDLGEINGLLTWVVQINEADTGEVLDVGVNAEDGTVVAIGS